MTASSYIESIRRLPFWTANAKIEEICGVQSFFEHGEDMLKLFQPVNNQPTISKDEYGDWQTNMDLALGVCRLLKSNGINPQVIIEPTCGKGNFVFAALMTFNEIEDIYGIEIHRKYLDELKIQILNFYIENHIPQKTKIHLFHHNIFDFDFSGIKQKLHGKRVLVLGNPPWVTNSDLGAVGSNNLPTKMNINHLSGYEAITGKSNFDIAEYICRQMIELLSGENASIALLLKNSVVKNLVLSQQENPRTINNISQFNIDARKEFGASTAASLFCCQLSDNFSQQCCVSDFYTGKAIKCFGWINNHFVADSTIYEKYAGIDGISHLIWWSGIKHDCAKVMELTFDGNDYYNGFGEIVDIEEDIIYPLIKSSDIKSGTTTSPRKYVIVTQSSTSEDTCNIAANYPKTYDYLLKYAYLLDHRASRIYKKRPRFSIFGIGPYSFKPYKIIVSGLYKKPHFILVEPINGKCFMLDDTCYMLGFDNLSEANEVLKILNSDVVQGFISSLSFTDAKRIITKDLLMRIDLHKAAEHLS